MTSASVSVLLPAYNAGMTLRRALASVRWQTCAPTQVVVVNDGSVDETAAVLREFEDELPLTVVTHKRNHGLVKALISGFDRIEADWIARLDADDLWLPQHLATLAAAFSEDYAMVATRALIVTGDDAIVSRGPFGPAAVRVAMCWDNPFVHTAVAFSRRHYREAGGYRHSRFEDYDLWARLVRIGQPAIIPAVTAVHFKRPGSLSDIDRDKSLEERFEMQINHWRHLPPLSRIATLPLVLSNLVRTRL